MLPSYRCVVNVIICSKSTVFRVAVTDGSWHFSCLDLYSQVRDALSATGLLLNGNNNVTAVTFRSATTAAEDVSGSLNIDEFSISSLVRPVKLRGHKWCAGSNAHDERVHLFSAVSANQSRSVTRAASAVNLQQGIVSDPVNGVLVDSIAVIALPPTMNALNVTQGTQITPRLVSSRSSFARRVSLDESSTRPLSICSWLTIPVS